MKSAFDCSHVKSVRAYAVLLNGTPAGRVVANWSDNPAGSVCTVTVGIWDGELKGMPSVTARAKGFGYCKFSAAFESAIQSAGVEIHDVHGAGESEVEKWLESHGYTAFRVI